MTVEMWTPPPDEPIVLATHDDALEFACVAEVFRPFDRLLGLADPDGHVRLVIVDPSDTLLARCGAIGLPIAIVVSTDPGVGGPLRETDIGAYRDLDSTLCAQRVQLLDWIHMTPDAELFRSMAVACGPAREVG